MGGLNREWKSKKFYSATVINLDLDLLSVIHRKPRKASSFYDTVFLWRVDYRLGEGASMKLDDSK